jgi:hypothetical protein
MFLVAVGCLLYDVNGKEIFNGKIGIWPLIMKEPAAQNSKNRSANTLITKPMNVTKDVYATMMIDKVLPAIRSKWPCGSSIAMIYIQHDNAKLYLDPKDSRFVNAAHDSDFNMWLHCQPANSPDMNILDLGFFNAIQSLQHQSLPKNIDKLIHAMDKAFEALEPEKLNVFLILQQCMIATMKANGGNEYKIPHMD